jgi:putative hydrolase of the HAD superfamily
MKFLLALLLSLGSYCDGKSIDGEIEEKTKVPKVLVFDFGGIVGGTNFESVTKALSPLLDISEGEAKNLVNDIFVAKKEGLNPASFWNEYAKKTGKILPDQWVDYFEIIKLICIRPNKEMLELIRSLKSHGYTLAMLSNVTFERAAFIRKLGVYDYFNPVILSCDIGVKKPDVKTYERLKSEVHVAPKDCLVIDNQPDNIQAARQLGFDAELYTSFEQLKEMLVKKGVIL